MLPGFYWVCRWKGKERKKMRYAFVEEEPEEAEESEEEESEEDDEW